MIAVGSDERGPLPDAVVAELQRRGEDVALFGPLAGDGGEWAGVSGDVARAVADGSAEAGIVICWTGTGASIAANKVHGVRAALCVDAETARMARRYNHANVLALSMRTTTEAIAREIVAAFLDSPYGEDDFDLRNVARLE